MEIETVTRLMTLVSKGGINECFEVICDLFSTELNIDRVSYSRKEAGGKNRFLVSMGRGPRVMLPGTKFSVPDVPENTVLYTPTTGIGTDVLYRVEREHISGVLILDDTTCARSFNNVEKRKIESIVNLFVTIYSMKVQFDIHKRAAEIDFLTGIPNKRMFVHSIQDTIRDVSDQTIESACLAVLDMDNFKNCNDKYGHNFGDLVLMKFGSMLSEMILNGDDLAFRFGGEEFAVIFKKCNRISAIEKIGKIRGKLKETEFATDSGEEISVTFSAGVAEINMPAIESVSQIEDLDASNYFFRIADDALYLAKDLGRDRTM